MRHLPGVVKTQAGRANGTTDTTASDYDGYAECVVTEFDPDKVTVEQLMDFFFEIIDPYSLNKQGEDVGTKYRTGVYSVNPKHLELVRQYIARAQTQIKSRLRYCRLAITSRAMKSIKID